MTLTARGGILSLSMFTLWNPHTIVGFLCAQYDLFQERKLKMHLPEAQLCKLLDTKPIKGVNLSKYRTCLFEIFWLRLGLTLAGFKFPLATFQNWQIKNFLSSFPYFLFVECVAFYGFQRQGGKTLGIIWRQLVSYFLHSKGSDCWYDEIAPLTSSY